MQDFDTLYKSFSNKDLLKITTRPELYQPLAVEAATRVLALRTLEEADRYQAADEIQGEIKWQNRERAFISKAGDRISSTFHYLLSPSETFDVKRWTYLVCMGLGIQYLWEAVYSIKYFFFFSDVKIARLLM